MSTFSDRLVKARKTLGITQKELATRIDIGQTRLNYWEKGKREPDTEMIIALSKALSADPNYLLGVGDDENVISDTDEMTKKYNMLDEISKSAVRNCIEFEYTQTLSRQKTGLDNRVSEQ